MGGQARFLRGFIGVLWLHCDPHKGFGTDGRKTSPRLRFGPWDGAAAVNSFYERPILNSPYRAPEFHHPLDPNGQPLEGEPRKGRRPSRFIVPGPASRKKASAAQASLDLENYTENALINEIRGYVDPWRSLRNPADWGVTAVSQRLLEHWRRPQEWWAGPRPFF